MLSDVLLAVRRQTPRQIDTAYHMGYAKTMKVLRHIAVIGLLVSLFGVATPASATPAGDNIIITEVEYDLSTNEAESEWFELYNPTPFSIDITGWTIQEGSGASFTFPSFSIDAGGYALVTNDQVDFHTRHPGVTVDIEMDPGGGGQLLLNNTGDQLTLRDGPVATGATVDFIAWESAVPGWGAGATTDLSVCRSSATDTDTPADLDSDCTPTPRSGTYESAVFVEFSAAAVAQAESTNGLPALVVSGRATQPLTVTLTDTLSGSASAGVDYDFSSPASITIPAGLYVAAPLALSGLTVTDDSDVEPDETIIFSLSASGAPLAVDDADRDAATLASLTYTIQNNDTTPTQPPTDPDPDPAPTPTTPAQPQTAAPGTTLANTGSSSALFIALGAVLIVAVVALRRTSSR